MIKKYILIISALAVSFVSGFAFRAILAPQAAMSMTGKATGIGGIFFKCKDPKKVREWYRVHLGLNTNEYGTTFEWRQAADSCQKGYTQWSPFKESTKYFLPSARDFMINYRVENIEALVSELKRDSVTVTDTIESYSYGKFVHIMDVEGNKVELWQPNDAEYGKMGGGITK